MAVDNVVWAFDHGYRPVLIFDWNGQPVELIAEQKPALVTAGLLFLGALWARRVPPINYGTSPAVTVLRGFTRDLEVMRIYREFERAVRLGQFRPGPRPSGRPP